MESIKQFEIVIANNHKCIFYPGQILQGHVILETFQPMMTKGIKLQYIGCLNIYWTELRPGTGNRCVDTKEFSGYEEYFNFHQVLLDPGIVNPKEQKFEFQYKLPTPLPENYEDELCLVEYYLEARIKHDNNVDNDTVARKEFSIINPLDLNEVIIPDIMSPAGQRTSQTLCCWCCTSSPITVTHHLRHSGYTGGQKIKLYAEIENNTGRRISKSYVRLMQERQYYTTHKKRVETEEIVRVERGPVDAHSSFEYNNVLLEIPRDSYPNVDTCQIFQINYYLEMVVEPKGAKRIELPPLPIVLGKIPLSKKTKTERPHARLNKNTSQPAKSPRERRKVRERRVAPSELTDTSDYVEKPKLLEEKHTISRNLTEQMIQSSNWSAT